MEMTLQLTIDCSDPQRMVAFWAPALGYVPEPAPEGHPAWRAYWEAMGVPAEELPPGPAISRSRSWTRRAAERVCGSSRCPSRRPSRTAGIST